MATTTTTTTTTTTATLFFVAAVFANCLFFSNIITTATAASPIIFQDVSVNNLIYGDGILFDNVQVLSVVDCARLCYEHRHCQTFTYTETSAASAPGGKGPAAAGGASCRGYSWLLEQFRHTRDSLGSRTFAYVYDDPLLDPCDVSGHGVLWQVARDEENYGGSIVSEDFRLPAGWYRFLNGFTGNTVMSNSCRPKSNYCGSKHPMWLDLQGKSLPEVGGSVHGRACGGGDGVPNCCLSPRPVTVHRCPKFYIYYLQATKDDRFNYCSKAGPY